MLKANERAVVRFFLASLHMEDLSDITLYPKVYNACFVRLLSNLQLLCACRYCTPQRATTCWT